MSLNESEWEIMHWGWGIEDQMATGERASAKPGQAGPSRLCAVGLVGRVGRVDLVSRVGPRSLRRRWQRVTFHKKRHQAIPMDQARVTLPG